LQEQKQKTSLASVLLNKRMLICLFTGFASGLPLYILVQLVPAWLRNNGVDLSTIGLFGIILFSYNWKFAWSPLMERFRPSFFGKRRGWLLITQVPLILLTFSLLLLDPSTHIGLIALVVGTIGFFSASQDIVLDAFRRELLSDDEMGMGTSMFVNAYKFSSIIPGGVALIIEDLFSWKWAIVSAGIFLFVGLITTFIINELPKSSHQPTSIREAIVEPFKEFFSRNGWKNALLVLLFLVLYKLGDNMATALETPFFYDLGFSGTEIGTIAKISKLWSAIAGSIIGGVLLIYLGINRSLWVFGIFQIVSIIAYFFLAQAGHNSWVLFMAVSLEYLGVGLGTVGISTFMAQLTSKRFTATQFALLSSIVTIPRTFATASTGFIIEEVGYQLFFVICYICAIPGMLLLIKVAPWNGRSKMLPQLD